MWILLLIFSQWLGQFSLALNDHDFHISKCLVEYKSETSALQISLHLFVDDLEEALAYVGRDSLYILTKKESSEADKWVANYLEDHFKLEVNGQPYTYQYLGKESAGDYLGMWCYMEVINVPDPIEISILNNILIEVFDDQKNIISIIGPENKKGIMVMQKGDEIESIKF